MFKCFCCGADVSYPQTHNGKIYGYTCIGKVSSQKKIKDTYVHIEVLSTHVEQDQLRGHAIIMLDGINLKFKHVCRMFLDKNGVKTDEVEILNCIESDGKYYMIKRKEENMRKALVKKYGKRRLIDKGIISD